jgi:DNA-binding transcriptional MerR regulator
MEFVDGTYRIGEIAARTGLTVDALRFYERVGLLPRWRRTSGGFRMYTAEALDRVRFIKQAQMIGLSLCEIRQLVCGLEHTEDDREPCAQLRDIVATKLAEVDTTLNELREFRRTLQGYLEAREHTSLAEHHEA